MVTVLKVFLNASFVTVLGLSGGSDVLTVQFSDGFGGEHNLSAKVDVM